jgi:phospholipase C
MAMLDQIQHVVVLMLENRSFDSMLGKLYPKSAGFDGLSGAESNPDKDGKAVPVWNAPGVDSKNMTIPDPDPGELWPDMNMQLFGTADVPTPAPAPEMKGFVKNYQSQTDKPSGAYTPNHVMHYFTPEQVPVLSRLARQFAVCDRWFASAPCQTWPNRFFAHTGTANGYENNSPPHFPYEMPTIYNRFEDQKPPIKNAWKIYFHDMPQAITLARLWPHLDRFRFYEEFSRDAKAGTLPNYSFIEPRYFTDAALPNDQHPPHVVTLGEQLIADVYNCLRGGPAWTRTLLIITYDEHGGSYDHVPPPSAKPPSANASTPFNFDRYGVRVPAVLVSPYIRQGTVLRPPSDVPFDHTSILATLRKRFGLGAPLSDRDAVAPDLESALTLDKPDNLGPESLEALPYVASAVELAAAKAIPLNGMQKSLLDLSQRLPANAGGIEKHLDALRAAEEVTVEKFNAAAAVADADAAKAIAEAKSRLSKLFGAS